MKIGEVAARAGVPSKTIRFWEEAGVLPQPSRTVSGYRDYKPAIVERLGFIRHAQAAGFTLDQIRRVLAIGDSGERPCEHVTQLIDMRLRDVDDRLAELKATRARLRELARRAAEQDPARCSGYCSILAEPVPSKA
jgi:MerR family transcriptional regulator, copper efflux regulator